MLNSLIKLILIFTVLALGGCASTRSTAKIESVALKVEGVTFYFSESTPDALYVQASGSGHTKDDAIKQALLAAVQQALGVLVVSELTISDDRVLKNISLGYATGMVKSYDVQFCRMNQRVFCMVNAMVTPAGIKNTIVANSKNMKVDGNSLYGQFVTQREAIIQRRKVTEYYFSKIRTAGLVATIRSVEVLPNPSVLAQVKILYSIGWNHQYRNELINYLKQIEKDTGGDIIRRKRNYSEFLMIESIYNQNDSYVSIMWASKPGYFSSNEAIIVSNDPEFSPMIIRYLYGQNLEIQVSPFNFCDSFQTNESILIYGSRKEQWRELTLEMNPEYLKNVQNISVKMGC